MMTEKIGIICAGCWGTSLAQAVAHSGGEVLLYTHEKDVISTIKKEGMNKKYLPHIQLHPNITPTHNLKALLKECKTLILAAPTMAISNILAPVKKYVTPEHTWIIASKGIEAETGALPSQIVCRTLGFDAPLAILSGPVIAEELAQQQPCALTLHSDDPEVLGRLENFLQTPYTRIYFGDDPIGAQYCGALRNVIAIAVGMSDGLGLGESARAALITRGIAEVERYTVAHGGKSETVRGISGAGDIILASTSTHSRHYRFGSLIGQGMPVEEAYTIENSFIEGTQTGNVVMKRAVGQGIDLAIISVVDGVLHGDLEPKRAFDMLLSRPRGYES